MIKRKKNILLIAAVSVLIAVTAAGMHYRMHKDDLMPVVLKSIQTNARWGYEIIVDGKTFIHQECIPAIAGNVSFKNKKQALLVGQYAIEKLKQGKLPTITVEELKQLGIIKKDQS